MTQDKTDIHSVTMGDAGARPVIVWGHGWGHDHKSFRALVESLTGSGHQIVIDFPGFGNSPLPPDTWGTAEYADAAADFIRSKTDQKIIWAGHSFGCRVGIQLAARHPDLVSGLFLIAGAGLPRKRPVLKRLYLKGRIALYKSLKKMIPLGLSRDWLISKFASPDYKNAGPLRTIFVRVVNENLTEEAKKIECPVMLVYGENDTETPPEIGRRLNTLIKNSEFVCLNGLDHYSILGAGRHQVAALFQNFMRDIPKDQ